MKLKVLAINRWATQPQFSEKPAPFVMQLAISDQDAFHGPNRTELASDQRCTA